jgi:hypothetical protein
MAALKRNESVTKRVWRITADAPLGEFVVVDGERSSPHMAGELHEAGWVESSYDLVHGLEVREMYVLAPADPALKRPQNS